jgi:flagellar basal-body rod protein FlgC
MSVFDSMDVSSTALRAQNIRLNTISSNLANINSTESPQGGPYREKSTVFRTSEQNFDRQLMSTMHSPNQGVVVDRIVESNDPPREVYNPNHPRANEDGYVQKPDINLVEEITDMQSAVRSYEANVNCIKSAQRLARYGMQIAS